MQRCGSISPSEPVWHDGLPLHIGEPACRNRAQRPNYVSALDARGGDTADEGFLGEQEQDEDGQREDRAGGHDFVPRGIARAALEKLEAESQREVLLVVEMRNPTLQSKSQWDRQTPIPRAIRRRSVLTIGVRMHF